MKAFLSHSSADKPFVEQVYKQLGAAQAQYDSATFDKAVLNVEAIQNALADSKLYVLFLSHESLDSSFVKLESRLAFEALAADSLRRILIVCVDTVSIELVPEFLRKLNIVTHSSSPGTCFRRIQSLLVELRLGLAQVQRVFIPRKIEADQLAQELTKPSAESPVAVALTGHSGIGRRSLLRSVMRDILPSFATFLQIELSRDAYVEDFYRALARGRGRSTVSQLIADFRNFSDLDPKEQLNTLVHELRALVVENDTLIVVDNGGLLDDDGQYPDYLIDVLANFRDDVRPITFLIQQRMPPQRIRQTHERISFIRVQPFSSEDTLKLVGARLKAERITFDATDLHSLATLVDGHPINVDFAVEMILGMGTDIKLFLKNPVELKSWKIKRAADYIGNLKFSKVDEAIIGLLLHYRYLPTELLLEVLDLETDEAVDSVMQLQDWHVVEFNSGVYQLSLPLVDALGRSPNFSMPRESQEATAKKVVSFIQQYRNEDDIPVSLIEPTVIAAVRSGDAGALSQWQQLILPSHYLTIAREAYNVSNYRRADMFVDLALASFHRMSNDAKVEAFRIKGMGGVRLRNHQRFQESVSELSRLTSRKARAVRLFLLGFERRYAGDLLKAEEHYLQCYDQNEKSFSVCRELSQVYLSLERFSEAENYARTAYSIAPTNEYVVDIMVGVLLGKMQDSGNLIEDQEFNFFMRELQKYGDGIRKSFYARRQAELMLLRGSTNEARKWADKAVYLTPDLLLPYFVRARVYIKKENFPAVERDLDKMNSFSRNPSIEEGNQYVIELFKIEYSLMIGKRQYRQAYNLLERIGHKIPFYLLNIFERELSSAVQYDGEFHDPELVTWAKAR